MNIIDYRSDTITKPTEKMRKAMYEAEVGDDVYGEDPTVRRLEELAAEISGKETAIFVPSGTMGNQLAVKTHTNPGDEIILEENCHIFYYEAGAAAALSSVQTRTIRGEGGIMAVADIRNAIRSEDIHFPKTSLICVENTHNKWGGTVMSTSQMKNIHELAIGRGIKVHLDGARIFNAAAYLNTDVKNITEHADSVMFCLSKGLCAPVGSMLAGSKDFIQKAKKYRKMFGGGMRQAGIIAAAGIVALTDMTGRLQEDHENARNLAEGLSGIKGLEVDLNSVQTNIVMCDIVNKDLDSQKFIAALKEAGILTTFITDTRVRFVTHYYVEANDIKETITRISAYMKKQQ